MKIVAFRVNNRHARRVSFTFIALIMISIVFFTQLVIPSKSSALASCSSGSFTEEIIGNTHILTFLSNGNEDASCLFEVPENVYYVDYLIVAGGGGGNSGGGGAGGVVTSWEVRNQAGTSTIATRNNPLGVTPGDVLTVNVGVGGRGGSGGNYNVWGINQSDMPLGTSGGSSVLGGITATGGGRGGFGFGCAGGQVGCDQTGATGGSNGGAAFDNTSTNNNLVSGTAYVGATSLGNIGGAAGGSGGYRAGSGGGGAGAVGVSANVLHIGGAGGAGVRIDISSTSTLYACGGGGGINENDPDFANEQTWISDNGARADLQNQLSYSDQAFTYRAFSDDTTWIYSSSQNTYTSSSGEVWYYDGTDFPWTNGTARVADIFEILDEATEEYIEYWINNLDSSTWIYRLNATYTSEDGEVWSYGSTGQPRESIYSGVSGGGAGGCPDAGRGRNIGVYGPGGPSSLTNSTSGANNFGHGGGGTDPESTVAGNGGSGIVIVRYVTPDSNCPNDHSALGVSTPIACTATVTIAADGVSVSTFVNGAPVSYVTNANSPVVSILNTPTGLNSSVNSGSISVSAPTNSSLAGGTYPLRYRITEGAVTSDAVLLVTVSDPGQHTPVLVLVDPRATQVQLPTLIVGNINATLVCVTPRAGGQYSNPVVDTTQDESNITKTLYPLTGGIRLIDRTSNPQNNNNMQTQVQYITVTKNPSDTYLIPGSASRFLDVNVSNTATGGNGSCTGGTRSVVEIRPIGIDQTFRKGTVGLKN